MKKLFTEVQRWLCGVSDQAPQGHALRRLNNLSGFVCGMIRKGSSHLPEIGSGLPQNINSNSKTVAAKRFVKNKWTDYEVHYLPFLEAFLRGIIGLTPVGEGLRIVIDGSQTGKDNAALMVSLVWQNGGIPICWLVKKGSKGHFKEENHVQVLEHASQIIFPIVPKGMPVTILGDGEFDGIEVQKLCLNNGWNYVLRTACNTVLYENGERFQARTIEADSEQHCTFIPSVEFTEKRFQFVNFLCWHDKKNMSNQFSWLVIFKTQETLSNTMINAIR